MQSACSLLVGLEGTINLTNRDHERPLARLDRELERYESGIVAFSGGVDSAVLLAAAARVMKGKLLAVTADSASLPRRELLAASALATSLGVEHRVVETSELDNLDYSRNDRSRCYFCKKTLFAECEDLARSEGVEVLMYGFNADDVGDFRPGQKAAKEFGVVSPLFDAGLGKAEIREIARELGLSVAEKPAAPCLSSRIPYGSEVTREKLEKIEAIEETMHDLGFAVCRARFDGVRMRLEVPAGDIARLSADAVWMSLQSKARSLGVETLDVDDEGFISGKLNRVEAP